MLDGVTNIKASEVLKELKVYIEDLPHYSPDEVAEALDMAIKALEQQPCEDCISRKEAEKWLRAGCAYEIYNLPSVKPQPKQGEWIDTHYTNEWWGGTYRCSLCGEELIGRGNYCPACGAEME